MAPSKQRQGPNGNRLVAAAIALALAAGLAWEVLGGEFADVTSLFSLRSWEAIVLGDRPVPVEPSLIDPVIAKLEPSGPSYRLMTIRHIPRIRKGGGMPHPYVGDCRTCHLYIDGPGAGTQPKTPVGVLLERLSQVHKLGPPLRPNTRQPHPPAGRCIKCHDIVVKVPVEKETGGLLWRL